MSISGVGSSSSYQPQVQSYQQQSQQAQGVASKTQGTEKSQASKTSTPQAVPKSQELMEQNKQYTAAQSAATQAANSIPGSKSAPKSTVDIYV